MTYLDKEPLLSTYQLGNLILKNRVVMSSMTRGRATNSELVPTELMAAYYAQRASAGLIVTESAWVSKKAIGFINLPGIYSEAQVEGWKLVTDAVHERNGKIFVQIVHSGAVSHPDFFDGELPSGPSAINPDEKSFTPNGFKDTLTPKEFNQEEIKKTIEEFKHAAENAKIAGFDGIELHAQLFTLLPQFLSKNTNQRTDHYGGSIENRSRLLMEIIDTLKEIFPTNCIGVKFTPAAFNPGKIKPDENTISDFQYILQKLSDYGISYVHLVGPAIELKETILSPLADNYFSFFRKHYKGTLIANLGFTHETANELISSGTADLVSFATLFIANPDLVERFEQRLPLAVADSKTYYSGGEKGYIDYPKVNN